MLGLTAVLKSRMLKAASNKNPPVTPKYCASRHSYERSAGPQHVCSGFAVLGFGIIAGFTGEDTKTRQQKPAMVAMTATTPLERVTGERQWNTKLIQTHVPTPSVLNPNIVRHGATKT